MIIAGVLLALLGLLFGAASVSDGAYAVLSAHLGKNRAALGQVAFFCLLMGAILFFWGKVNARTARIRASGLPGKAIITKFDDTGVTTNRDPVVTLHLHVMLENREPYTAVIRHSVPRLRVGQLTSKEPVAVKVDPEDPKRIVIEWDQ
ncbi:hypothetical protein WMF26_30170 [Sorangium sp. So ce185]|uniref:hypothetical protein n=1 Tax=Sorangium sp. So ce185 TaxID=3133287 RepID=UPI003F61D3B7